MVENHRRVFGDAAIDCHRSHFGLTQAIDVEVTFGRVHVGKVDVSLVGIDRHTVSGKRPGKDHVTQLTLCNRVVVKGAHDAKRTAGGKTVAVNGRCIDEYIASGCHVVGKSHTRIVGMHLEAAGKLAAGRFVHRAQPRKTSRKTISALW